MKIKSYISAFFALLFLEASAQYETVIFNYDKSFFNEGSPLPAESKFMLTGNTTREVQIVEVRIFETEDIDTEPLYQTIWKRHDLNTRNTFTIPVNYPLRGNEKYTVLINYYQPATQAQQEYLIKQLEEVLWAYIDQSYIITRNSLELRKHPKTMVEDMNTIVNRAVYYYKNRINFSFDGFSDIVLDKLYQIRNLKLNKAKFNVFSRENEDEKSVKLKFAMEQIEALKLLVSKETSQFANSNLLAVTDSKKVISYPTEKTKNILALNVGYAGVYKNGDFDEYTSGDGAFIGISIPFGKMAFSSPFWAKTSLSTGVFLQDIEFDENDVATGPIVKRPLYIGLGYRALPFIRINAGATVLQSDKDRNTLSTLKADKIYVRPFVGLSFEFDFWIGLNK